jgi:hypothetical protein
MDYSLLVGIQTVTERRVFRPAPQRAGGPPLRSSSSISSSIGAVREAAAGSSVVVQAEGQQQCGPLGYSAETLQGPGNYRLGIIDPLQRWDMRKRLERLLKIVVRRCATKLKSSPTPNLNPRPSPNSPYPSPDPTPNLPLTRCASAALPSSRTACRRSSLRSTRAASIKWWR